ncbi:sulfurtransferase [Sulfuricella sp. T08]|uniref:rhodanese-like domain-containing protein n=1 Tax=Sulfuricella sp. T08 TaxID=1632857 RepID=UPI0006179FF2|nr:rhodanese-like domain-containing protein [Sulfuricella sp. T08]GAO37651.1 sulfurtransferase [Sulfuricella sp. T08]
MIARLFAIVLFALSLGACAEPPYTNVDNAKLKELLAQGVPLYDIRLPEEWRQTGVVEGSRKLTFFDAAGRTNPEFLPRFTAEVNKNAPVVLICRSGNRTDAAARELAKMGYTQVYNVRNGITHWMNDNNPVIRN